MKIVIIGTGGVGGYFGGRLAQAGNEVTFVARGAHFEAMRKNGLRVKSVSGDFSVKPVNTVDKINEIPKAELILLGVKAWQIKDIAKQLKTLVDENTMVMPLQNGVSACDELLEELDAKNVVGGSCRIISKIEAPGIINHMSIPPAIVFGELDNSKTERIIQIKEVLDDAGIDAIIARDIHAELWKKFISICASGLCAVTRSTYGEIRELEGTRQLLRELLTEIYKVGVKGGIGLKETLVDRIMGVIDLMPYNSTSSLTRDVMDGKPSEIDYQNGMVVKLGEKYGVETPVNRFIYYSILPMERRARFKQQ